MCCGEIEDAALRAAAAAAALDESENERSVAMAAGRLPERVSDEDPSEA